MQNPKKAPFVPAPIHVVVPFTARIVLEPIEVACLLAKVMYRGPNVALRSGDEGARIALQHLRTKGKLVDYYKSLPAGRLADLMRAIVPLELDKEHLLEIPNLGYSNSDWPISAAEHKALVLATLEDRQALLDFYATVCAEAAKAEQEGRTQALKDAIELCKSYKLVVSAPTNIDPAVGALVAVKRKKG